MLINSVPSALKIRHDKGKELVGTGELFERLHVMENAF